MQGIQCVWSYEKCLSLVVPLFAEQLKVYVGPTSEWLCPQQQWPAIEYLVWKLPALIIGSILTEEGGFFEANSLRMLSVKEVVFSTLL